MKSLLWLAPAVVLAVAPGGCRSHGDGPLGAVAAGPHVGSDAPITAQYREDIASLCDVVHLSKADQMPPAQRAPIIAMWLGPHLHTSQAHDFLVAIQPLTGARKAQALDDEAHRVGLASCALSAAWR